MMIARRFRNIGATDSTVKRSERLSGSAIESVTMTSLILGWSNRCRAGPEKSGCVAHT